MSCTLSASCGGFGGRTGLYDVSGGVPIKEATKKGYKMAYPGDSIDLAYPQMNTRRGRVGRQIAHTPVSYTHLRWTHSHLRQLKKFSATALS